MSHHSGPYISITSPSPTAIKYTFSNRRSPKSISIVTQSIRILLTLLTLLIATYKTSQNVHNNIHYLIKSTLQFLVPFPTLLTTIDELPRYAVLLTCLLIIVSALRRTTTHESLLVLRSLGIQTSSSSGMWLIGPTTRFIPSTQIQDIVINEAFRGFEVRFYLAVIVRDAPDVVVVFPKLLPRRADLEVVWKGARACLHGTTDGAEAKNVLSG